MKAPHQKRKHVIAAGVVGITSNIHRGAFIVSVFGQSGDLCDGFVSRTFAQSQFRSQAEILIPLSPFKPHNTTNQKNMDTASFQKRLRLNEKDFVTRLPPRFKLEQQPNEEQRKAYANENRYITPNPLVISETLSVPNTPSIRDCRVSVRLLYVNGEELEPNKNHILTGQLTQTMFGSENERKAKFALKVTDTSNRTKFKLCFTVTYTCEGKEMTEVINSSAFRVIANRGPRRKTNTPIPRLIACVPQEAPLAGTEVWIRGNGFVDRESTFVYFGELPASIVDIEENLIVCKAPQRSSPGDVPIMVTNVSQDCEEQTSALSLPFRYNQGLETVLQSNSLSIGPTWCYREALPTSCNTPCNNTQIIQDFPALPEEPFPVLPNPTTKVEHKLPGFTLDPEMFLNPNPLYDLHQQEPFNLESAVEDPFEYPEWGSVFHGAHPPLPHDFMLYQYLRK